MNEKVYTREDGVRFNNLLMQIASNAPEGLLLTMLLVTVDHISVNEKGVQVHFNQAFQDIQNGEEYE